MFVFRMSMIKMSFHHYPFTLVFLKYEAQIQIISVYFGLSSRMPMIKMLWHYVWLYPDGRVSLVICTNTNLVHPTWLTRTIRVACVSNLSIYEACFWVGPICFVCLYMRLYIFLHPSFNYYCGHVMNSCFLLPNIIFLVCRDEVVRGVQR